MYLPFIHRIGIGVHVSEEVVHWVELTRTLGRVRKAQYFYEPIEDGNIESALARLLERAQPKAPYVSGHLAPSHVRHFVVDGTLSDEKTVEAWIGAEVERRLPPGMSSEDFVVRSTSLDSTDETTRHLIAYARRSAVEEQLRILRSVGLEPISVGTLEASIGHAFGFDASFVEGRSAIHFVDGEYACLLFYENGRLLDIKPLPGGGRTPSAIGDAAAYLLTTEASASKQVAFSPLLLVGNSVHRWLAASVGERDILCGMPLQPPLDDTRLLPAASAPAASLAVAQLYPTLPALNFLESDYTDGLRQEREKREALRAVFLSQGAVLLLLFIVAISAAMLGANEERVNQTLASLAPGLAAVERARLDLDEMRLRRRDSKLLFAVRTNVSGIMELAGSAAPEGVWLQRLNVSRASSGFEVTIQGLASDETDISTFMHRLEEAPLFSAVQLVIAEVVAEARQPRGVAKPVRHFEIRINAVVPGSTGPPI